MKKGGWILFPAAFFFALNFAGAGSRSPFLRQLAYGLLLLLLFSILRRVALARILPPLVAGTAAILFAYGLVQKFVLFPAYLQQLGPGSTFYSQALVRRVQSGRIFSLFALPTLYALVVGLLLLLIIHYALNSAGWRRTGWITLAALGLLNLLLTQSFGGLLGFAAGLLVYLPLSGRLHGRHLAPLLMALSLVIFVTSALRFREVRQLQPLRLRLANWFQAARLIGERPVFGCGLGNYATSISPHVRGDEQPSLYAHNFFLQLGAEVGLPALLLAIALLALALRRHLPGLRRPGNAAYTALLLQILLYNLIDIGVFFHVVGLALVVTLALLRPEPGPPGRLRLLGAVLLTLPLLAAAISDRWQVQGDIHSSLQQVAQAERAFRRSLAINPTAWRAATGLAQVRSARGDEAEARRLLARALELNPHTANGHYLYSRSLFRAGEYLAALIHAGAACAITPNNTALRKWHESLHHHIQAQLPPAGN